MSELKPCPFCGGKAQIIKPHGAKIDTKTMPYRVALAIVCTNIDCAANMGNYYERQDAISAWNRRAQPENKPLTLDELRGMDGEPVWVKDLLIPNCSAWHFVLESGGELRLFDTVAIARGIVGYSATTGENYGKTWLAYRYKPEEEQK